MPGKKNKTRNGDIVPLLQRIALANELTNQRLDAGFRRLDAKIDKGFVATTKRLDNMIDFLGAHHADHERRIQVLEALVLPKPKG